MDRWIASLRSQWRLDNARERDANVCNIPAITDLEDVRSTLAIIDGLACACVIGKKLTSDHGRDLRR